MEDRIAKALDLAFQYGDTDGDHHKQWVIDQMVRALTGCPVVTVKVEAKGGLPAYEFEAQGESEEYRQWVRKRKAGEDGPDTYRWQEGIPP